jgi:hypothetical protein
MSKTEKAQKHALIINYLAEADAVLVNVINSYPSFTLQEDVSIVKAHDALKFVIASMKNRSGA